ncbi:hypothetical protein WR25_18661 isoform A [Diploscapter pachys]|uniref:Actin interacting protein 3-like C-terminal domain-containing protein n=1 Tax=Diploscapter pachys TaxID=2018661 RepID=A0A2A2LJS0_9BILA|nr:hypothetical protein WR25_18661 isoform A [Diploscapter pachys]
MPGLFSWKARFLGRKTPEAERAVHVTLNNQAGTAVASEEEKKKDDKKQQQQQAQPRTVRFEPEKVGSGKIRTKSPAGRTTTTIHSHNEQSAMGITVGEWQNEYGEARLIANIPDHPQPIQPQPNAASSTRPVMSKAREWQYADDVRVSVTPMAAPHVPQPAPMAYSTPVRPIPSPNRTRGSAALAALREREEERRLATAAAHAYAQRNNDVYAEPAYARHLDGMNVVFLQANDEIKRAILPRELQSVDQVKMAFVRAFPNITRHYIDNPRVRIYIQEQSKGSLFYELDDPMDIKDKTVLKLKEKHHESGVGGTSSPVLFDVPDYQSETEMERPNTFFSLARPASAMARTEFGTVPSPGVKSYRQHSRTPQLYEDSYASDTNSHDGRGSSSTRSGSVTPSLDKESRKLSSLFFWKKILALHGSEAGRETSEEPLSIPESLSSHTQHQLGTLRYKVQQANTEIRQLRRIAQVNAHTARNLIKEASEEINRIIAQKLPNAGKVSENQGMMNFGGNSQIDKEKDAHADKVALLLGDLTKFEQNVEDVRASVLANKKKLRMTEVESLTEKLSDIGRTAARLKTEFPGIQTAVEKQLKEDMERIVRQEKYIRDQLMAVDQSLRRCKALANIMVTMKKLAMVQDPTLQRKNKENGLPPHPPAHAHQPPAPHSAPSVPLHPSNSAPSTPTASHPAVSFNQQHISASFTVSSAPSSSNSVPSSPKLSSHPPTIIHTPAENGTQNGENGVEAQKEVPAPYVPNVARNEPPLLPPIPPPSPITENLDGILDEVGQPDIGVPPRPPSRFSVLDVRQKFTKPPELPENLKTIIDDVARRASPAPVEKRQELEERQQRLDEKQKHLQNQFQTLQQLTLQ